MLMISCRPGVDGSVCKSALPSGVSLATPLRVSLVPALIRLSRIYVTLADVHSLSDGPAAYPPLRRAFSPAAALRRCMCAMCPRLCVMRLCYRGGWASFFPEGSILSGLGAAVVIHRT